MTNKSGRPRQRINNLRDELIGDELRQVTKVDVSLRQYNNKNRKCCSHRCPDPVYFNTLLLIIYLNAIETLICRREMSLVGSTAFGFAQNTILMIFKYRIELSRIVFDKMLQKPN